MKQFSSYAILLCMFVLQLHAQQNISSSVKRVTVYLQGATIERTSDVSLEQGSNTIVFNNLSPDINEQSIQLSGLTNVTLNSLKYTVDNIEKAKPSKELESFQTKLKELQSKKNLIENTIEGYQKELKLLGNNQRVNSDNSDLSLERIKTIGAYYRTRTTELNNAIYADQQKLSDIQDVINDLQIEINKRKDALKERRGVITVQLNAERALALDLDLQYAVYNAGWFPIYDIKAKDSGSPLNFTYNAHVYQQTGTDWEQVKVTLSTGDPSTSNQKPELQAKYLNFVSKNWRAQNSKKRVAYRYNPTIRRVSGTVIDEDGLPLPGVNIVAKGTSTGTQTDFDGRYSIDIPSGAQKLTYSYIGFETEQLPIYSNRMMVSLESGAELDEVVVTAMGSKVDGVRIRGAATAPNYNDNEELAQEVAKVASFTTYEYVIKTPYTISSKDDVTIINIDEFSIPAQYEHYAAPELDDNVFLIATIKDWEQYNLLQGDANIYFENSYAGKLFFNPQVPQDSLNISLGVDKSIQVNRERLNNFKSTSFLGGSKITDRDYKITIKNLKPVAVTLKLQDRIPISQNRDIKVDDIQFGDANYDKETGILTWNMQLEPNETEHKSLSYQLKYPRGKQVND